MNFQSDLVILLTNIDSFGDVIFDGRLLSEAVYGDPDSLSRQWRVGVQQRYVGHLSGLTEEHGVPVLPPLQMRHHEHHLALHQRSQRQQQRIDEVVVVDHVRRTDGVERRRPVDEERRRVLVLPSPKLAHVDGTSAGGNGVGVGVRVEPKVGEDMGEVGQGDVGAENGSGSDANESSTGSELDDADRRSPPHQMPLHLLEFVLALLRLLH